MRRKKERSKQGQTNKQTRQSNTAHPRQSLLLEKMSCLRWDMYVLECSELQDPMSRAFSGLCRKNCLCASGCTSQDALQQCTVHLKIVDALKTYFEFGCFRPGQLEAVLPALHTCCSWTTPLHTLAVPSARCTYPHIRVWYLQQPRFERTCGNRDTNRPTDRPTYGPTDRPTNRPITTTLRCACVREG